MRIISISNQKGGCGKTTTAVTLSSALSFRDFHVLLIDLDPQSHAGLSFGIDVEGLETSIYDVLREPHGQGIGIADITIRVREKLHIAPSTVLLCATEQELSGLPGREYRLAEKLGSLEEKYDYIIIDCPPSIGLLTFNALTASDEVIIPIEASVYSIHGVSRLLDELGLVERNRNRTLPYTVIETMYDHRVKYSRTVYKELQEQFDDRFFPVPIHQTVRVREAALSGMPLHDFDPQSSAFMDYLQLADFIVAREGTVPVEPVVRELSHEDLAPLFLEEGVRFSVHAPEAHSVQVAGDFNSWNPGETRMEKDGDGVWRIVLPLETGRHSYKFVVDGNWIIDPSNADFEKDQWGNVNSLVEI